jgi:hypothetical protein
LNKSLVALDNQRLAIEKWNGELPNVNFGAVPFLNLKSQEGGAKA